MKHGDGSVVFIRRPKEVRLLRLVSRQDKRSTEINEKSLVVCIRRRDEERLRPRIRYRVEGLDGPLG